MEKKIRTRKATRGYKLKAYGNKAKTDTALYTHNRFIHYLNYFLGRLFFNGNKHLSTKGMGRVANQAKHKARGMVSALLALQKEGKVNIPHQPNEWAYGKLEKSKGSTYDYWVRVSNLWGKTKVVRLPLKSHKALNKALKNHWELSEHCEFKLIKGELIVKVFVSKEVEIPSASAECIGADVGINKSVCFSDGYKGMGLREPIRKAKESQQERYRQRMKFRQVQKFKGSKTKSYIKQILDSEAKELVRRSKELGSNIVVESRKILQNLRCGRLNRWARCYFANRLEILCKEGSIFFLEVNPYQTSLRCHSCDKLGNREKEVFVCENSSCSEYLIEADADINAAKVLKNRGHAVVEKYFSTAIIGVKKA